MKLTYVSMPIANIFAGSHIIFCLFVLWIGTQCMTWIAMLNRGPTLDVLINCAIPCQLYTWVIILSQAHGGPYPEFLQ